MPTFSAAPFHGLFRPIVIDIVFSDISFIGTGKASHDSRMLASPTAYSQASPPKRCIAVRKFRTSPKMMLQRKEPNSLHSRTSLNAEFGRAEKI